MAVYWTAVIGRGKTPPRRGELARIARDREIGKIDHKGIERTF